MNQASVVQGGMPLCSLQSLVQRRAVSGEVLARTEIPGGCGSGGGAGGGGGGGNGGGVGG